MRTVALLLLILGLVACDDGDPQDAGPDGDADADVDGDADADGEVDADYPELDCGDDPRNHTSCMLNWPDGGPENGTWCGGMCRPLCGPLLGLECPGMLVCHRSGDNGVCFEP